MKDKVKVLHIMGENFASNQKPLPGVLEAFGGRMQTKGIDSMIRCCVPIKKAAPGEFSLTRNLQQCTVECCPLVSCQFSDRRFSHLTSW